MKYQAVIIGAGPAGIAAGIILSKSGISTIIIEKDCFPRRKTCAGILTQKTISLLDEFFSFCVFKQFPITNQIILTYKGEKMCELTTHNYMGLVERSTFDHALLKIYKDSGGQVVFDTTIATYSFSQNMLTFSNGTTIKYDILIAADGVHSHVRRMLGIADIQMAFCLQDTVRLDEFDRLPIQPPQIQLNLGAINYGYSWIVPNQENIIIGSGMFSYNFDNATLLSKHEQFCKQINFPIYAKRYGAFVPSGQPVEQSNYPYENIVLVGDAAGLADPLTGEGIYYALLSGIYAARAYQMEPLKFKTNYIESIQSTINKIKAQQQLCFQFYNEIAFNDFFLQFRDCPDYLSSICDEVILTETKSYHALINELKQFFR